MKQKPVITNARQDRPVRMSDWIDHMRSTHVPRLTFRGRTAPQYRQWRRAFEAKYHELLGPFPRAVPLNPVVLEERRFSDYVRLKIIYDTERGIAVSAWVCLPRPLQRGRRYPAVVCCHGHGYGAKPLVGLDRQDRPAFCGQQKHAAVRLAQHGYVTIAPDWRTFGDRAEPPERLPPYPVDPCNRLHLVAEHWGYLLLALDIWDGMKAVDYLRSRLEVDPARIGCVGLSFGGTMSLHLAARDRRIRAACVSGYFHRLGDSLRDLSTCGSQTLPGILCWGDLAEIAGLICPRALLVQIGEYDSVFSSESALKEFPRLETIYEAAGARAKLGQDLFEGGHEINFPAVLKWFNQWLSEA